MSRKKKQKHKNNNSQYFNEYKKPPDPSLDDFYGLTVNELSIKLSLQPSFLMRLLEQKSIEANPKQVLCSDDIQVLKPFLISRLNALQRLEKDQNKVFEPKTKISKKKKRDTKGFKVYDVLKFFGLGKLIYIRSK